MGMFLGEISFVLELSLFVAGLTLWHFGRQGAAGPLRAGGLLAMVGATLAALCTAYFMVRYHVQGDFDHPYPFHPGMARHGMMEPGEMMQGGGMGPGMMHDMMKERMGPGAGAAQEKPESHEEHHPEQAIE